MANEYEQRQRDSVLYGLSKGPNKSTVASLPSFQVQITKNKLFGEVRAYTDWKKQAWKAYRLEETGMEESAHGSTAATAAPTPLQYRAASAALLLLPSTSTTSAIAPSHCVRYSKYQGQRSDAVPYSRIPGLLQ
jgi:hypothetical protein